MGCFCVFSTSPTRSAQLWHLFRDAARHLLLGVHCLCLSYHRGCSREVFGPGNGMLAECFRRSLTTRCALRLSWYSTSETLDSRLAATCRLESCGGLALLYVKYSHKMFAKKPALELEQKAGGSQTVFVGGAQTKSGIHPGGRVSRDKRQPHQV